jgi:tRNA dimethylallyltransferase
MQERHLSSTTRDNSIMEEQQAVSSSHNSSNLVVVLAGPTAVGKSDVAARLCQDLRGMIVSADSVQAYRGVMIGANKPTLQERKQTPHLLVDVVDTTSNYNAAEWQRDALRVIAQLLQHTNKDANDDTDAPTPMDGLIADDDQARRKEIDQSTQDAMRLKGYTNSDSPVLPVVVGGTMMYLQWLVHGRPDADKPSSQAVGKAHAEMAAFQKQDDWQGAVQYVESFGPLFAQRITILSGKDWYRLRRTLEIALTVLEQQEQEQSTAKERNDEALIEKLFTGQREDSLESYGYDVRCFFLCPDDRMTHTALVDERCEVMIKRGLLRETTDLQLAGQLPDMAARAIGYRQTLEYLLRQDVKDKDEDAFQEYVNLFTTATRRYSKKQMQWFRKDDKFVFVPVAIKDEKEKRVSEAAKAIQELVKLPREEFDRQCFSEDSVSAKTMKANETQAKGMKFYQFKRYLLKPGTSELANSLADADQCTNQLQAKKRATGND